MDVLTAPGQDISIGMILFVLVLVNNFILSSGRPLRRMVNLLILINSH